MTSKIIIIVFICLLSIGSIHSQDCIVKERKTEYGNKEISDSCSVVFLYKYNDNIIEAEGWIVNKRTVIAECDLVSFCITKDPIYYLCFKNRYGYIRIKEKDFIGYRDNIKH